MYANFVHRTVLIALLALAYPAASFAGIFGVGVTVGFAPPSLPTYVQPPCPAQGYVWTPGYWAYSDDAGDYYWVPGTWVMAPSFGLLWTPGYWGSVDAEYVWHEGYWGPHVGFYGGINYGFGYFGSGFVGGYWRDRDFYYNRAVTNVSNVNVTNVYNRTVINNNVYGSRPSFNGKNGVEARPTHSDLLAAREPHRAITAPQRFQATSAVALRSSLASVNHGHPQVVATSRPGVFHGHVGTPPRHASSTPATPRGRAPAAHAPPSRQSLAQAPRSAPAPRIARTARSAPAPRIAQAPRSAPAPRIAQAPRGAPAPRIAQAPRSAPALHSYSTPPHLNHQASAQNQRRS